MTTTFIFIHSRTKAKCLGCGKDTMGALQASSEETSNAADIRPCCPRCRDTKSKFQEITGQVAPEVVISTFRSKEQAQNLDVEFQLPPMLCRALKDVKPTTRINEILTSSRWIVAEKLDGVRAVAYFTETQVIFLTRNKTQGTGNYNDITANVIHLASPIPHLTGTVLDGELLFTGTSLDTGSVVTDHILNATVALTNSAPEKSQRLQSEQGYLKFVVFDCLKFRGLDIRNNSLTARYERRDQAVSLWSTKWIELERAVRGTAEEKEAFYQELISLGGEGVIYKDTYATYSLKATSRLISWVKRKVRVTTDAIITGWKPGEAGFTGLVGALEVSIYKFDDGSGPIIPVAMVSSMELVKRQAISAPDGSLRPELLGQVVEISFQELASRSQRGRHATLDKFRPDKNATQCTFSSMVKG